MTFREAIREFKELFPQEQYFKNGFHDRVMQREDWNNWTDSLCKDGRITLKQYESWDNPF